MSEKSCCGCRYDLGGGCCAINMELECRDGGEYELKEVKNEHGHIDRQPCQ